MNYNGLLSDQRMDDFLKVEGILSVELGLRLLSCYKFEYVIGPDKYFNELEKRMDVSSIQQDYRNIGQRLIDQILECPSGGNLNIQEILQKIDAMRTTELRNLWKATKSALYDSDRYKACAEWSDSLGLRVLDGSEIRDDVDEIFICKPENEQKVRDAILSQFFIVKSELLGYPFCCSYAFGEDYNLGILPYFRGSEQIKRSKKSLFAYFADSFVPCKPNCEKAVQNGKRFYLAFKQVGAENAYIKLLRDNLESIKKAEEFQAKLAESSEESMSRIWEKVGLKKISEETSQYLVERIKEIMKSKKVKEISE